MYDISFVLFINEVRYLSNFYGHKNMKKNSPIAVQALGAKNSHLPIIGGVGVIKNFRHCYPFWGEELTFFKLINKMDDYLVAALRNMKRSQNDEKPNNTIAEYMLRFGILWHYRVNSINSTLSRTF